MIDASLTPETKIVVDYGHKLEKEMAALQTAVSQYPAVQRQFPARWLALKLLEQDADIQHSLLTIAGGPALLTRAQLSYARLEKSYGEDIDILIADRRYTFIHDLVGRAMQKTGEELTLSDRVDQIVTHRFWGVVIFLAIMWGVFKMTADVSAPLLDWVDGVINGPITGWSIALLSFFGFEGSWFEGLVVDGVIAGVGGVLVFVPVLLFLYVALAVLENSGYMARAAFVMDNLMAKIGLQGKSFLPMMVGFGCTVPAIYATRTLENEKDRIMTSLLVPFMSCGARLPVYVLFAAIFFPRHAGLVVFGMYLLGIVTAVCLGFLMRKTIFKEKEQTALLMELPPYHLPNLKVVWAHTWERIGAFIKNAWSLILVTSIILWFLTAIPVGSDAGSFGDTAVEESLFATVSGGLSPWLAPLGFGSWEASGALITGFVAKEVVVSTMVQTYGLEEREEAAEIGPFGEEIVKMMSSFGQALVETVKAVPLIIGIDLVSAEDEALSGELRQAVYRGFESASGGYAGLAGLAFMVFVLIYTPCMVALAAEKQELGSRWMWTSVIGQLLLAWLMACVVFQVGKLLLG